MLLLFLEMALLAPASPQEGAQVPPSECPELDRVIYSEPVAVKLAKSVVISSDSDSLSGPVSSDSSDRSPQGTATLILTAPDFSADGPWNSVATIRGNQARPLNLRVRFFNHASYGVRTRWLNEKLVWFQVWCGRIVSTDLILDVETRTFLYAEEANYGTLLLPCDRK